jgi:SnoaL-like domain
VVSERHEIEEFLNAYRNAFRAFDASAVADLFTYPCQITSDAAERPITTVADRGAWVRQLERLLDAYRELGVRSAEILDAQVAELSQRVVQATVRWRLLDEAGARIYDFDASYTLIDFGQGMQLAAIAHNETARLRAALEQTRPGQSRDRLAALAAAVDHDQRRGH